MDRLETSHGRGRMGRRAAAGRPSDCSDAAARPAKELATPNGCRLGAFERFALQGRAVHIRTAPMIPDPSAIPCASGD